MTLSDHARRELELIGATTEDPRMVASLLKAVEAFAEYGHSGSTAEWARETLNRLLAHQPLSPITTDPAEWQHVGLMGDQPAWQNLRDSRAISHDGGKTHWLVDDPMVDGTPPVYTTLDPHTARMVMSPDVELLDEPAT